jgi:hypothetical protein
MYKLPKNLDSEFKNIFKISIGKYFNPLCGFNLVKFDMEILKTPNNKSMNEFLKITYEQKGFEIINKLIALHYAN